MIDPVSMLPVLIAVGGVIGGITKSVAFIREGEQGIKLRFGKAIRRGGVPKVYGPGFHPMVPFVHSLMRRHVRQTALRSDHQEVLLSDKTVFLVSTVVIFKVADVYRALFEIDELEDSIDDFCMAVLRDVLSQKKAEDMAHQSSIADELQQEVGKKAEEWGVEFLSFRLTNCSPTARTADLILVGAMAGQRVEALRDAIAELGLDGEGIDPTMAAVIVGVPVATNIGAGRGRFIPSRRREDDSPRQVSSATLKVERLNSRLDNIIDRMDEES